MFGVIDRFEGEFAVIETDDGKILNLKINLLPKDISEGDVINLDNLTVDKKETKKRKNDIKRIAKDLFEDF